MSLFTPASFVLFSFLMIGCGDRQKSPSSPRPTLDEETPTETPNTNEGNPDNEAQETKDPSFNPPKDLDLTGSYLVVSAGFSTCPTDAEFSNRSQLFINYWLNEILTRRPSQNWLLTCFGLNDNTLKWINSNGGAGDASRQNLVDKVLTNARSNDMLLIGHSYGGFMAMTFASEIQAANLNVLGLITLDPISPNQCKVDEVVRNVLFEGTSPEGCRTSPQNIPINTTEIPLGFKNYFQTDEPLLHSAEVQGANINTKLPYKAEGPLNFTAHNAFRNDSALLGSALEGW